MNLDHKSAVIAEYIQSHPEIALEEAELHNHMGAILTDAFLQAGINYKRVVEPRVRRIKSYPHAKTTSGFLKLLHEVGHEKLLDFHGRKPLWILEITTFFDNENVQ